MKGPLPKAPAGFTLIETLITLSMFSLLMGVLTAGFYGGVRYWQKADARLIRSGRIRFGAKRIVKDLENLIYDPEREERVFQYLTDEQNQPVLKMWRESAGDERAPAGSVIEVTWRLKKEGDAFRWLREAQAYVAERLVGDPHEETILERLKKVEYRFFDGAQWVTEWADQDRLPVTAQIRLQLSGAPRTIFWTTASMTGGGAKK